MKAQADSNARHTGLGGSGQPRRLPDSATLLEVRSDGLDSAHCNTSEFQVLEYSNPSVPNWWAL